MLSLLAKIYNPKQIEKQIYSRWEKSGFFDPDKLPSTHKKPYCITMAPPNVTGSLHIGHALEYTMSDILIRYKRMRRYKTLWLPGTDHAGIATQNVVEKELKKEGITRHELGQERFLERVLQWKEKYGHIILDQLKKIGVSADWSRTRFTMDPGYQEAVKTAFLNYYAKGWIYRAERVVNWCVHCGTSLSDLELEYKEEKGTLYYINYPLADKEGYVTVATTRPETMLGDTAVAVNPNDKRYKNLVGKKVILPIQNREIPIIEDRFIDKNFGTGAVKVTPAHDALDAEIGERYKLSAIKVIGPNGRMTIEAGNICDGLKISECRAKIIEELGKQNLLEKEEQYTHNIAKCYRCGTTTEPLPSLQWFLKMDKLAAMAIKAVKSGRVEFHPEKWEKVYFDWLKNIKDWCISRQIWWGHKIPIEGETDVLDTWFSSALWPFATLGWPEKTKDLKIFYPTDVITNDRGILNLWDTRMIFSGLEFMKKEPFQKLIIHATVLTKEGKRMSKSLGTGVDPIDLINQYGADATRFGLIWQAMGNQDIHWSEEHVVAGRKFCNKIWNSARFVLMQMDSLKIEIPEKIKPKTAADKKILSELARAKKDIEKYLDKYEFGQALHKLYDFYWHKFCDVYIEKAKKQGDEETKRILVLVLFESLKMLHPFMPFITEAIFQMFQSKAGRKKMLMIEPWNG